MPRSLFELIETKPGGYLTIRILENQAAFRAFLETMRQRQKDGKVKPVEAIIQDRHITRSQAISRHWNAHLTNLAQETGIERDRIYLECLLLACEMEPPEGGLPYPYIVTAQNASLTLPSGKTMKIPMDVLIPLRTSGRSNREMITAVEAAHRYAITKCDPIVCLRETPEDWGGEDEE